MIYSSALDVPAFDPGYSLDKPGDSSGDLDAFEEGVDMGGEGRAEGLSEEISQPETWAPAEELMGYQEQILAELQVTNVFLFHIEVLLFLVLGGFVFSLMYKAIKHNVTNHFT